MLFPTFSKFRSTLNLLLAFLLTSGWLHAAPYFGEEAFTYRQPDGEAFQVRLYGDEFFAYEETADGYLVIRDPNNGLFCYAKVTPDGSDIISTGGRVGQAKPAGLKPKQRLGPDMAMQKSIGNRNLLGADEKGRRNPGKMLKVGKGREILNVAIAETAPQSAPGDGSTNGTNPVVLPAPPPAPTLNQRVGLVLLASFPDFPGDVTKTVADIDNYCNAETYTVGGNATSIYGYFKIQSNGKLSYKNNVTAWFTAANPRSYYTDNTIGYGTRARDLIKEGLAALKAQGFDFTQCDGNNDGRLDGVNCFYAGGSVNAWSEGLWPHQSSSSWTGLAGTGLSSTSYDYQITDMPANLSIGTFCHENGHMICDFPDLYSYDGNAANVGGFSLMASSGSTHPRHVDPYLKIHAGWADVVDITSASHQLCAVQQDRNFFYRYKNPAKATEYFLFEVRGTAGYEGAWGGAGATNPANGLVIYHANQTGSNTSSSIFTRANPPTTTLSYTKPYELMVVEATPSTLANGDPWYTDPSPSSNDSFSFAGVSSVSDSTSPDLKFWAADGRTVASGANINSISAAGATMTFIAGSGPLPASPTTAVTATQLQPNADYGDNAANHTFSVFNSGGGTLSYAVSDDAAWLSCTPVSGDATTEADVITVAYTTAALAAGNYTATITIDGGSAGIKTIGVTLTVNQRPTLAAAPGSFSLTGIAGTTGPTASFNVSNTGGGTVAYTITKTQAWLTLDRASGTVSTEQDLITASLNAMSLPKGVYTDTITIASAEATNSPLMIPVTFTVDGADMIVIAPNGGESWVRGSTQTITWLSGIGGNVKIELFKNGVLNSTISTSTPNDGSFTWPIPAGQMLGSNYRMRITSVETLTSFDQSFADFTIAPPPLYYASMDTNPGWTLDTSWAYGQPTGAGQDTYGGPDPSSGQNGPNVIGYCLDGDYEPYIASTRWATTPAINCSVYQNVKLSFQRWLGVEGGYDKAYIEVSSNGTAWTQVWASPSSTVDDTAWTYCEYDISAVADGQATVFIRWGLGTTDYGWNWCGWNLDEVVVDGNLTGGGYAVVSTESGGSTAVTEGGATDTYTLHLSEAPTSDVTITVAPDTQLSVSPDTLTFTTVNWATPQTVTVTAVNDSTNEFAHTGAINYSASSADANYNAIGIDGLLVSITDNDNTAPATNAGPDQTIYLIGATPTLGWSYSAWTGDADSAISDAYTYTVAHCFGDNSPSVVVNNVTFTSSINASGTGWSVGGGVSVWQGNDDAAITGSSENLAQEFIYNGSPRTVTFTGLTAGQAYEVIFYSAGWETGSRVQTFSGTSETPLVVNQDFYGNNNGIKISCMYVASGTSQTFTITPTTASTFHLYAMLNREINIASVTANLDGTVSDANGDSFTTTWSVIGVPSSVSFDNANAVDTTVTFTAAGVYTLRLSASDPGATSTDDVVITVNSALAGYNVTYSGNNSTGGTVPVDANNPHDNGTTVTVLGNSGALVRAGYTLNNWNTAVNGSGTSYAAGATFTISAHTTLYAQWTAISYAVTFDLQSGSGGSTSITATSGSAMPTATPPTRTGYTFGGYYTQVSGGGTRYYNAAMASSRNWDIASDTTLYAYWTPNTYTITFDKQSGSWGSDSVVATYGSAMPTATVPTRTGYTFGGYYTQVSGGGTQYYDAAMASAASWDLLVNTTLYAKWTANIYDVAFDANGGAVANPTSKQVTYDSTYGLLAITSRTGYAFNGWFTAASGGTEVTVATVVATVSNHTLYAQWTADTYVVSYQGNGNTGGTVPSDQSKIYDVNLILATNSGNLAKTDHTFIGWNTALDGSGTPYAIGSTYSVNSALTLYAQWIVGVYLTWDANGSSAVQTNGAGSWEGGNLWWNGMINQSWISGASATFGGPNTAGGAVTLAAPTTVEHFTFNQFSGTYSLGTAGQTITLNSGINKTSTSAAVTFVSPITLGGDQTWTNESANTLSWSALDLGTGTLIFSGSGDFSSTAGTIAATAGSIIHNGSGLVSLPRTGVSLAHTGTTTISGGGTLMIDDSKPAGNFNITNGILTDYYQTTQIFSSGLGTGDNQIRITGSSGFGAGNGGSTWRIGATGSTLIWGATGEGTGIDKATGFFNPTELKLRSPQGDNNGSTIWGQPTLDNRLDLNSGARTIDVYLGGGNIGNSRATIDDGIQDTGGTGSLTKTGGGMLIINGTTSTWGGSTNINGGILFLGGTNENNIGGGSARNITIASGAGFQFNALSNAVLNRIVETSAEIAVMTGGTSNNLDFSSSTGANLPNAFIGNWASNGAKCELSGTITPGSNGYKLGATGSSGALGMVGTNKLTGARGLIVGQTGGSGVRVVLAGANDFTGDTVINTGAKLTLGDNLAIQNSTLDVGVSGGNFALNSAGTVTGVVASPSPTFGGLSGSRALLTVFTNAVGNNETNLASTAVSGFTLNLADGKSCTYSGGIAEFAVGTTLTKTGLGTQILSGANTYTGNTNVSVGKLFINGSLSNVAAVLNVSSGATLGGTGTLGRNVTIADGGKLEFDISTAAASHNSLDISSGRDFTFSGASTLTITSSSGAAPGTYALVTGGNNITGVAPATVNLPAGWVASVSISGNSLFLNVSSIGSAYTSWVDSTFANGVLGNKSTSFDFDAGGLATGVEWVVGGDPTVVSDDADKAPVFDNTTDPDYFIYSYRRTDVSNADPKTSIVVEYGNDLSGWTSAVADGTNVIITPSNDSYGLNVDKVEVKIKRSFAATSGKLFSRLKVVIAP